MKKNWVSKGLTGLFACTLVLGTASFASAKSPDKGKAPHTQHVTTTKSEKKASKSSKNQTSKKQQSQKPNSPKKGSKQNGKSQKGNTTKKETKITSQIGKTIEKQLNASELAINNIIASVNSYFKVDASGTAQVVLNQDTANTAYNSYTGKLTAQLNKLHAVDKQISVDKKKYPSASTDLATLATKSQQLQQLASNEIKQIQTFVGQATTPTNVNTGTSTSGTTTDTPATGTTDTSTSGTTTDTSATGTTDTSTSGTTTDTSATGTTDTSTSGTTTDTSATGTTDTSTSGTTTDTSATGTTDTSTSGTTTDTTTTGTTDTSTSGTTTDTTTSSTTSTTTAQ